MSRPLAPFNTAGQGIRSAVGRRSHEPGVRPGGAATSAELRAHDNVVDSIPGGGITKSQATGPRRVLGL